MRRGWLQRAIEGLADASALYGMPSASIELVVLEQREREALERERLAAQRAAHPSCAGDLFRNDFGNDDDEGDGGSRRLREPVAV